jgi:hypothetical protein
MTLSSMTFWNILHTCHTIIAYCTLVTYLDYLIHNMIVFQAIKLKGLECTYVDVSLVLV